jgi:hypothetical protein
MITDTLNTLTTIYDCISTAVSEFQCMKDINEITNKKFPIYERILYSLQESIERIIKIFKNKIPIRHTLKFNFLDIIQLKLDGITGLLDMFKKWDKIMGVRKCCSFEQLVFFIRNPRPSNILEQLETAINDIEPVIKDLIKLEYDILGTAIDIEHPILQKAWVMVGANQLNETDIPLHTLVEHLFSMYETENNYLVINKEYILKRITDFLTIFDGMASLVSDGRLSIVELNYCKPSKYNSSSVKEMVNITDKEQYENLFPFIKDIPNKKEDEPEEDTFTYTHYDADIPIDFKDRVCIDYTGHRTIKEPLCIGYGADFNNVKACEFIVSTDLLPSNKYQLYGVEVECSATDQGFGGTNQSHLRYQINDEITVKAFQVDSELCRDNIYHFSIPPEDVKLGDTVKLWIFSPGWSGWCMWLNSVKASANFIPANM